MKPFLSGLGISAIDQIRNPTEHAFPSGFNSNCKTVWDLTVKELKLESSVEENWNEAIQAFVENCVEHDLYPFSNLKQSDNDQILITLIDSRRKVVRFLNQSKMLDLVNIRTTRRECEMNTLGFTLRTYGLVQLKDPTFEKWLYKAPYPGFRLKHEGSYHKQIGNDLTVIVYNEGASNPHRWHVGYEIVVRKFPDIPGHPLANSEDLESFVLKVLWTPVLKSHRPNGYHRRLI